MGGTALEFEVDTGSELSTLPACVHHKWLAHVPLHHSSVVLFLYDGSVLPTKGVITAQSETELSDSYGIVHHCGECGQPAPITTS